LRHAREFFEQIVDYQNIRLAFLKSLRGKRASLAVIRFCKNVDENLEKIRSRLNAPPIQWGSYRSLGTHKGA
jgi:hypothetical protein